MKLTWVKTLNGKQALYGPHTYVVEPNAGNTGWVSRARILYNTGLGNWEYFGHFTLQREAKECLEVIAGKVGGSAFSGKL